MPDKNFKKLYVDELKGLYNAENQLVEALLEVEDGSEKVN